MELEMQKNINDVLVDGFRDVDKAYFTRTQIGELLEYGDPNRSVANIHNKHKERLDQFSAVVKLITTDGKAYDTFVYNIRGVFEICRWSRQPKADEVMDKLYDFAEEIMKVGYYSALAPSETIAAIVNDVNDTERRKILIDGIRMSAIDQTQFIAEYMGISDRSIPDRMVTLSGRNRMAKQRMKNWGKRIYTINDVNPPKPIEDFILLAALNRAKRGKYTANCFVEFCGTTYFSTDGYCALIEVLRRGKRITEDEATEWINIVTNQWFTAEAK